MYYIQKNIRFSRGLKRKVVSKQQYGFQTGKSTETAILDLKELILHNIEQKLFTVGTFLDFCKAFDSIKHGIFIKDRHDGIRAAAT